MVWIEVRMASVRLKTLLCVKTPVCICHRKGGFAKACVFGLIIGLTGCSNEKQSCGANNVTETLKEAIAEKYKREIRGALEIGKFYIEEKKEKNQNALKTCSAEVEVYFNQDYTKKWDELIGKIKPYTDEYVISNSEIILRDKVTVNYDIKKNEADGSIFLSGSYRSNTGFKLSEHVVQYTTDIPKTLEVIKGIHSLRKFDKILDTTPKSGEDLKSIAENFQLKIESCTENYDRGNYELSCKLSNVAGHSIVAHTKEANQFGQELNNWVQLFAALSGQPTPSTKGSRTIIDPEKINELLNQNLVFTTKYSEPNLTASCKELICE